MIRKYGDVTPVLDPTVRMLEPCTVAGDVHVGADSSIWFGATVRGDIGPVRIGSRVNVQENSVIHESLGGPACVIEDDVTVGHAAVIHGAHLKRGCLIGMGAVVLDGAVIGEGAMVGAGAMVPQGLTVPPGHLAIGVPAKVTRPLSDAEKSYVARSAPHYVAASRKYETG